MARWALLFLVVLATLAGAALWLLDESAPGPAAAIRASSRDEAPRTRLPAAALPQALPAALAEAATAPLSVSSSASAAQTPGGSDAALPRDPPGPTRTVAGQLLRAADDSPIADVRLLPSATSEVTEARSGEHGCFSLAGVPTRDATLQLTLPGGQLHTLTLDDGTQDLLDRQWRLDTGFVIEGLLLDTFGSPIPGAQLTGIIGPLSTDESWVDAQGDLTVGAPAPPPTRSGTRGTFRLLDLPCPPGPASVALTIRATGFVDGQLDVIAARRPSVLGPFTVHLTAAGAIAGTLDLDTPPGAGSATDTSAGTTVDVVLEMTESSARSVSGTLAAQADAEGRYRIDGVPPGRFVLRASAPDLAAPQWRADVEVVAGATTTVDWTLGAGATVSGRLVDSSGRPVPQVLLRLEQLIDWPAPAAEGSLLIQASDREITTRLVDGAWWVRSALGRRHTRSDSLGRYAFSRVAPGRLRVLVMATPAGLLTPPPIELQVAERQFLDDVDFLVQPGAVLRGRIEDLQGQPLTHANVQLAKEAETTHWDRALGVGSDNEGRFQIGGLAPDVELTLWVNAPGYVDHWRQVLPGGAPLVVRLKPAVVLAGLVTEAETGQPVAHYAIIVTQQQVTRSREVHDASGHFALELDDDLPATITVSAPGRLSTTVEGVHPSESLASPLEIRLPPGG